MSSERAHQRGGSGGANAALFAAEGIPLIGPGDNLASEIVAGVDRAGERLLPGDIIVVAQKIVSKAEGRQVDLDSVQVSARAIALAQEAQKDPRIVELILRESSEVVRVRLGLIIAAHRSGYVMANAGIDQSNVDQSGGRESVLLLPEDSQRSATALRAAIMNLTGVDIGVIINDSLGRAWRNGTTGAALGVSGVEALLDLRGREDLFGRPMQTSMVAVADQLAAAASLLQGEASEGRPVVVCRGFARFRGDGDIGQILRPIEEDLFR